MRRPRDLPPRTWPRRRQITGTPIARFERLLAEAPRDVDVRRQFADALGEWGLGWFLAMTKRPDQAEPHYRRAFEMRRELVLDPRVEPSIVSEELPRLAQLTHTLAGHLEPAVARRKAEGVRGDLAAICTNLAGRPMSPESRHELATPLGQYGSQLMAQNRPPGRGGDPPPGDRPRSRELQLAEQPGLAPGQRARRPSPGSRRRPSRRPARP